MKKLIPILAFISLNSISCYTFTGASIDADVKTISILFFPTYAANSHPNLSQKFTIALQDKFIAQTNLQQIERDGHLNFEGEITEYKIAPVAIQSNETTALNRLTISVTVRFTNTKNEKQNFDSSFSRFADYDSAKELSEVEESLIDEINEQLVQDIFNASVTNW